MINPFKIMELMTSKGDGLLQVLKLAAISRMIHEFNVSYDQAEECLMLMLQDTQTILKEKGIIDNG